jgi:hypothetical protein
MMTELTFSAGQRVTLDLRDCRGDVRVEDGEAETVKVTGSGEAAPFVLRDGDTFRLRLDAGGAVAVPPEVPVEVIVPAAVRLRLARHGETEVIRQEPAGAAGAATGAAGAAGAGASGGHGDPLPVDLSEFVRAMSEQSRRIFDRMTEKVRQGGFDATEATDEVARRLDEAAERIDEQVQRVASRVEQEVEKAFGFAERASRRHEEHQHHAAGRQQHAEERARHRAARAAERAAERVERRTRVGERVERRAGRGRWWFTDKLEQAVREATAGAGEAWSSSASTSASASASPAANGRQGGATATAARPEASPEERRVILDMLAQGTITADQAARLLDALGN